MLMTGTAISGERAYDLGLANRVVEPDDLLDTASQLAAELVSAAPGVVAGTKSLVRLALSTPLSDGLIIERDVVSDLFDAPAGRAGFAQFRKRSS
jgi:enoyl-CoA hydratase/carnithine racemase